MITNWEMVRQVYSELERRLKMEWDDIQENADCTNTELSVDDYNDLRTWLMGALQGIYTVFYTLSGNRSKTVDYMLDCERNSELLTYFLEFKYRVLFDE